ncbi:MAG: hypothetical protein ABNH26_03805 [Celeribacter sp.]|jgi:hypothetical protein
MTNPFQNRALPLDGPASDIVPVTPDDGTDLLDTASALYVEIGGAVALVTLRGASRVVTVPDMTVLPVAARRVLATGTTASGIHALVTV